MSMQTIKNGGFVREEIAKVNSNFAEIEADYAKKTEIPAVPTKTSELTNDSGFITAAAIPTNVSTFTNDAGYAKTADLPTKTSDLTNDSGFITNAAVPTKTSDLTNDSGFTTAAAVAGAYVAKETGKGLSTEDFTSGEKIKLAALEAPTKTDFTTANWSNGTYTTPANDKMPVGVMRKTGSNYGAALVDVQVVGTNIVITADEAFDGYLITV